MNQNSPRRPSTLEWTHVFAVGLGLACGVSLSRIDRKDPHTPLGAQLAVQVAETKFTAGTPAAPPHLPVQDLISRSRESKLEVQNRSIAEMGRRLAQLATELSTLPSKEILHRLTRDHGQPATLEARLARQLMVASLAQTEPVTGLGYAETRPAPEKRMLEEMIFATWAETQPREASTYLSQHLDRSDSLDPSQIDTLSTVATAWAKTNPIEALKWARSLPEELRAEAQNEAIARLLPGSSGQVLDAFNASESPSERADILKQVVETGVASDPQAMARWLEQLPNSEEREAATATLSKNWAERDLPQAMDWIQSMPAGPSQDTALQAILESSPFRADPENSASWALTIQNPKIRSDTLNRIAARWEVLDPARARQFAERSPLP